MGIPDTSSLVTLISKLISWVSGGGGESGICKEYWMPNESCVMCYECDLRFTVINRRHHCRSCGRVFCSKCMQDPGHVLPEGEEEKKFKLCKFCFRAIGRESTESDLLSPTQCVDFGEEKFENNMSFRSSRLAQFLESQQGSSPHTASNSFSTSSPVDPSSPFSLRNPVSRSDEEDAEVTAKHDLIPSSEYCQDISDVDINSINGGNKFYSFKSVASSPLDSPSVITSSPNRADFLLQPEGRGSPSSDNDLQESPGFLRRPETEAEDLESTDEYTEELSIFRNQSQEAQQPLDFENNGLIWFPPPPDDEGDDVENDFFAYDDEDDEVGNSGSVFSSSCFSSEAFSTKDKSNDVQKVPLRVMVHGHFRALVSELLKGGGICTENENDRADWLEIVASLSWQAANFVKPDTSRGGSMDPGDYVKVKCMASGNPCDSILIRGVVCSKNVKHKRMTSQYQNPKLLLLGGALEYQRVPNQLASMNTLLQQEIDHLKMAVAKIGSHRPNVLLVEKSVSSYAQEYLLAKEISLVLNIKRPLLERIARCTGAHIVPSVDHLASARLGHCELFRLERLTEEISFPNQPNKKSTKTLMFFEGCPRRLGCTVLLRGKSLEELKKVKHVVQYAVFAAYHLSLETSFLADEGASLPKIPLIPSIAIPERLRNSDGAISVISSPSMSSLSLAIDDEPQRFGSLRKVESMTTLPSSESSTRPKDVLGIGFDLDEWESSNECFNVTTVDLVSDELFRSGSQWIDLEGMSVLPADAGDLSKLPLLENPIQEKEVLLRNPVPPVESYRIEDKDVSSEYFSTADNSQSILVSFSSRCVLKGTLCERSHLFRIKFYGSFDKPLGRFLRDDLFDQIKCCHSCNESVEDHVRCYTHQQGSLTISVKRLPSLKLPGERDGKIWMWHRCLKCALIDGVPPATRRVIMSDAAWGLSFGKFLELSFSNHATANRVASCGHSLQRDCLRYYGFGSMVAFFRYSPIDILSVHLPPLMLEFGGRNEQDWIQREAAEVSKKMEFMYAEVFDLLESIEQKILLTGFEPAKANNLHNHILELKELLKRERNGYEDLLQPSILQHTQSGQVASDILELNRLRRCLLIDSYMWDRRFSLLDSFLKLKVSITKVDPFLPENITSIRLKDLRSESFSEDGNPSCGSDENNLKSLVSLENPRDPLLSKQKEELISQISEPSSSEQVIKELFYMEEEEHGCEGHVENKSFESLPSPASNLSEKIDLAWSGSGQANGLETGSLDPVNHLENLNHKRAMAPVRVHSFDSALRFHDKLHRGLSPASLHLSSVKSFHASGDFMSLAQDPISDRIRTYTQTSPMATQKLNFIFGYTPLFISSSSHMVNEGARLLLPLSGPDNVVVAVYDNEPTSIISYVLSSKKYMNSMADKFEGREEWSESERQREDELGNLLGSRAAVSSLSSWQSFTSVDSDDGYYRGYGNYVSDDTFSSRGVHLFSDSKRSPHFRVSFGDESSLPTGKVKFSVTCYFAKQFDALRKICCPTEVDFIRSLSRCRRWSAQGGKSNVYFAKTLDERFIIKQVTKTELESFEEFAPEYFKYLMDSLSSGSPTCLAKVLGIYQITVKHLKGGKEVKMDLMVMENLFFRRSISRVYDLKGSARSRYNPDTSGSNKVLLDMNLLETLRTNPMFLSSKAKRNLERAVWNDTNFLASIDVMDYSLLVGVDDGGKELVLGIIDYMRQYTWDKHLETWVKASGILGGPKNASPTVISPKEYKKRFRKAMSTYFLTVPDPWSP